MITAIREVRRAKGMTLDDVARACRPPTTPQQIGRIEVGTRRVSVEWLNRIAAALGVEAADLVRLPGRPDLPVVAVLGARGATAPDKIRSIAPAKVEPDMIALQVECAAGDYRAGDAVWCRRVAPEAFDRALNRDVLVPLRAGRFVFGRLIGLDRGEHPRLQLLSIVAGSRQQIVNDPPWLAVASRLIRDL